MLEVGLELDKEDIIGYIEDLLIYLERNWVSQHDLDRILMHVFECMDIIERK